MKDIKKIIGIALLMSAVAFTACSDKKGNPAGSGADSNGDPDKRSVETKAFSEKYQFEFNGCDTGKHEFTSDSQDDVKKQLCDGLLNEKANNFCAQGLRKNFFDRKCSGIAWAPVFPEPTVTPTPANNQPNYSALESKIRQALDFLVAREVVVSEEITGESLAFANKITQDMDSCGFSYVGPKCFDYFANSGFFVGQYAEKDEMKKFAVDVKFDDIESDIIFAFDVSEDGDSVSASKLEVLIVVQQKTQQQNLVEYLSSPSVNLLATIEIEEDTDAAILASLDDPSNIRQMFHMALEKLRRARNSGTHQDPIKAAIIGKLVAKKDIIGSSDDFDYQKRIMNFVLSSLEASDAQTISIAEQLVDSSDQQVAQMGAVSILFVDSSRVEFKGSSRDAVKNHDYPTIRKMAVQAISQSRRDLTDETIIIGALDDGSQSVRETAITLIGSFELTNSHLNALSLMADSQYPTSRKATAGFIAKIDSREARSELIGNMSDGSQSVREEIVSQLSSKTLSEDDLSDLKSQQSSDYPTVRKEVAKLIGSISGENASLALIEKMSDGSQSVRAEIVSQLNNRSITNELVSALKNQLENSNYPTARKGAAHLIGKNRSRAATLALVAHMSDGSQSVREEIVSQLQNRTITDDIVSSLTNQLESSDYPTVRRDAADLIGKNQNAAAVSSLIKNMSDGSQTVRDKIFGVLSSKSLNDANVGDLKNQFGSDYPTVRKAVATLLGTIKTQSSLDALLDRLPLETSQSVKQEIEKSIALVR